MARRASSYPTELELTVLRLIWRDGPSTIRQICTALEPDRPLAFTSVLTIMKIMVKKGYLEAERRPRSKGGTIYKAKVAESKNAIGMFNALAHRLFGGSLSLAIQNLVRAGEIDPKELEDLRKLINETEGRSK